MGKPDLPDQLVASMAEPVAVIGGPAAAILAVLLRDAWADHRLDFNVRHRQLAEPAIEALERAGRAAGLARFDVETSASDGGSMTAPAPETVRESALDAAHAAEILGVTRRRVGQMAEALGGRKVGGRWLFSREEVLAEAERRKEA